MKKLVFIVLACSIFACQEQHKVGYIDNAKVIDAYQEKIDIEEKFKVRDEAFTKRTDSISKAFQLEAQDFQIKARSMSNRKAQELYDELGQKQQLLQQQIQFEQQQLQQAFNTEIDSAVSKMKDYVKNYGQQNGYTFIFGTSDNTNSIMYGDDAMDITDAIIEGLNEGYKKPEANENE